jgi:hypothetical protein
MRKNHKEVSTRDPTLCTAKGLGIGAITVKSLMAEYRHPGHTLEVYTAKPRGKLEYRAGVNLQPVLREYIWTKKLAGQRVGVEKLRHYLLETHGADIPPVTLWGTLQSESFVNKNHSGKFTWYLEEDGPWVNQPSGKGPPLIIVHAMTVSGWVQGAELVFEAAKRTGDCPGQMNWENFPTWFCGQLLPNIPSHPLIILDNSRKKTHIVRFFSKLK